MKKNPNQSRAHAYWETSVKANTPTFDNSPYKTMSPIESSEFVVKLKQESPHLSNKAASNKIVTLKRAGIIKNCGKNSHILCGTQYNAPESLIPPAKESNPQPPEDPRQTFLEL